MKHIKKGQSVMKLLKIESGKGLFLVDGSIYKEIDKISKDDLISLAKRALTEGSEFDQFEESLLPNQVHQIIYKSIYDKLIDLSKRREEFKDETDRLYLVEFNRYNVELGKNP